MSLRVVGVYLRTIRRVHRPGVVESVERGYLVLAYAGKTVGKLAISRALFDRMRADGVPLLKLWKGRPILSRTSVRGMGGR